MTDIATLEGVLRKAHLAGDMVAAKKIASALRDAREAQKPQNGSVIDALGQGATLGFGDEIVGGINATIGTFDPTFKGTTFGERYRANRDGARADFNAFSQREPEAALTAEITGGLLTGGLGALRAGAIQGGTKTINTAKNIGSAGLLGGVYGAGSSDAEDAEEIGKDALISGLVGAGTGGTLTGLGLLGRSGLKKIIKPETSKMHNNAVDLLKSNEIPLTTGQQTGSTRLRAVETDLGQSLLGPNLDDVLQGQRGVFQSKLMEKAGFVADDIPDGLITETALDNARDRFSQRYTEALKGVKVKLDNDDFVDALAAVESKHQQFLPVQQKGEIKKLIDELIETAADPNGITGDSYQAIRSRLGKRQRSLAQNDPSMAGFFKDMKTALDDSFLKNVDDITGANKKNIDKEYARFKELETIFKRSGGSDVESGLLPLPSLNRESKKHAGDKEWRGLISAASQVLPDTIPNSGTASRTLNNVLPFGLLSKAANAATFGVPYASQGLLAKGTGGGLGRTADAGTFSPLNRLGLLAVPSTNVLTLQRN